MVSKSVDDIPRRKRYFAPYNMSYLSENKTDNLNQIVKHLYLLITCINGYTEYYNKWIY